MPFLIFPLQIEEPLYTADAGIRKIVDRKDALSIANECHWLSPKNSGYFTVIPMVRSSVFG